MGNMVVETCLSFLISLTSVWWSSSFLDMLDYEVNYSNGRLWVQGYNLTFQPILKWKHYFYIKIFQVTYYWRFQNYVKSHILIFLTLHLSNSKSSFPITDTFWYVETTHYFTSTLVAVAHHEKATLVLCMRCNARSVYALQRAFCVCVASVSSNYLCFRGSTPARYWMQRMQTWKKEMLSCDITTKVQVKWGL